MIRDRYLFPSYKDIWGGVGLENCARGRGRLFKESNYLNGQEDEIIYSLRKLIKLKGARNGFATTGGGRRGT